MTPEERVAKAISGAPFPSERSLKKAAAAIEAHLAALADAGLVIVPREPTEAMIAVGDDALMEEKFSGYIWRSMMAVSLK